jgi:hypothetical protein
VDKLIEGYRSESALGSSKVLELRGECSGETTLRLPQYGHVISIFKRQTSQESIHIKRIQHARFSLIARRRAEKFAIGVEETGETPYEGCANLIGVKCSGASQADLVGAAGVSIDATARAFVYTVVRLLVAY